MTLKDLENSTLVSVLNALHEGVCVVDREGTVLLWNKKAEEIYDIPAQDIIGKPLAHFIPNALLLKVLKEKKAMENFLHKPRQGRYFATSARPLYIKGELVGAVSSDKDVTEITNLGFELEETRTRLEYLQEEVSKIAEDGNSFGQIIGKSRVLKDRISRARQVAKTNIGVLIVGESGTGKEVFARAIHQASGRKGPFVAINCSAIPEHLFESEMFGYVAGAFTGALRKGKMGKFEMADRGTLFLDEIGDMPAQMQAKLLRVLQEQKIYRVGSEKAIDIDVRVISASNKDLENMVKEGQFREDLYYRLNVVKIELPPLRERKEDIPLLVECFVQEFCQKNKLTPPRITPDIIALLMDYEWKGNVRELRNTVEHLVIFSQAGKIDINSIPDYIREQLQKRNKRMEELFELKACVAKAEQQTIARVMQMVKGNKSRAAKILNIPRSTLYYKLNYYNMKEYL